MVAKCTTVLTTITLAIIGFSPANVIAAVDRSAASGFTGTERLTGAEHFPSSGSQRCDASRPFWC